ncbi:MAG: carboxypeptidase regulatory-like domain-containing protein [Acidobacteria bacterium]|nr:carboxypeptidase regulatory-like domain-containing protein [Acidobacteriota bacterium]
MHFPLKPPQIAGEDRVAGRRRRWMELSKGGRFMKKVVNLLMAGYVMSLIAIAPASTGSQSQFIVEASNPLAFIAGTVKDDKGAPLSGAIVAVLEPQPRGKEVTSVRTDMAGKFSAGVAPGTYRLRATATGFASLLTRVRLERPVRMNFDFALKRTDTLVQKRGDSDDYRWIARSVPRHAMNLQEAAAEPTEADKIASTSYPNPDDKARGLVTLPLHSFHGMAQFMAVGSSGSSLLPGPQFFGTNFALSGMIGDSVEMAIIGQRGMGSLAPQRFSAIATVRPSNAHQVTAAVGYAHMAVSRKMAPSIDQLGPFEAGQLSNQIGQTGSASKTENIGIDQLSVSTIASWQVFQPLLVIYGFDYSSFIGSAGSRRDSILPRFAVQYAPSARVRLNAAVTPGTDRNRQSLESYTTENLQAGFETTMPEIAFNDSPIIDRSRRFETGVSRLFGDGSSSIEATAFYDLISGHGVGLLALPLEASPYTQAAFQQVANRVTAMNGAARGMRVMFRRQVSDHLTASAGYSFGRGTHFNNRPIETLSPAEIFRGGFFQVATGKLDLDFSGETGTRVSTVIRLSPSAVVFAIDPFAGQMSVYDPNINIYVTQDLPSFGLPVRWQAIVDVRNLLDQASGIEDGNVQLIAARTRRTVRGGLAFRW